MWEDALQTIPAPEGEKTVWGPQASAPSEPDTEVRPRMECSWLRTTSEPHSESKSDSATACTPQTLTLLILEPRKHPWMRQVLHNVCQVR